MVSPAIAKDARPSKDLARELIEKLSQSFEFKSGKKNWYPRQWYGCNTAAHGAVCLRGRCSKSLLAEAGVEVVYKSWVIT